MPFGPPTIVSSDGLRACTTPKMTTKPVECKSVNRGIHNGYATLSKLPPRIHGWTKEAVKGDYGSGRLYFLPHVMLDGRNVGVAT